MYNFNLSLLIDQLASAIAEKLQYYFPTQIKENHKEECYRTRKETSEMLNISLPTLNNYTKNRILTGYRVGARVLYKQSEIEAALSKMKFGRD